MAAALECQAAEPSKPVNTPTFTNRLAQEKSPYLLQHKHNPVDWYPWGEEAFAKARREQKPIFLSIGYSTCHWCHVMAHESFEDPEVGRLLNEHFVAIKLDREERPDVDRVYMTFVQATTGGGGWPMSVFLTPDLKPFLGGTYYPPEDKFGRPGFKSLLKRIADGWKNEREGIIAHGTKALEQLREYAGGEKPEQVALSEAMLLNGLTPFVRTFDEEHGGFGEAPKFPRPVALNFLFRIYARADRDESGRAKTREGKAAMHMAMQTLRKMAAGGMHDHLGGGFHRYSVDKFWHIPHFEKMLYDQAQLACSYLDAFQIARSFSLGLSTEEQKTIDSGVFQSVARGILDYVRRDLTDKAGGFHSAEDADSIIEHGKPAHAEGAFYVWAKAEIEKVLGEEEAKLFNRFYGVEEEGNAPAGSDPHGEFKGKNTLIQRMSIEEASKFFKKPGEELMNSLAASRKKLFEVRAKRPRPHLDDKIITAWNGLMISAFARGAQLLAEPAYLESAQRAAKFLRAEMWKEGQLRRSYREGASAIPGFAEDYAYLIQGLLDLYEADFDIAWVQWAVELQTKMDALFADPAGGYFSTSGNDPSVLLRLKEDYDGAEPSPSSIAAMNLLRLAQFTGDEKHGERARKTLAAFSDQMTRLPSATPQMLCALDASLAKPRQIVIAGARDAAETNALLFQVHAEFLPNKILMLADGGPGQAWLGKRLEFFKTVGPLNGKPAAYVCENFVCQLPTSDPQQLRDLLGPRPAKTNRQ